MENLGIRHIISSYMNISEDKLTDDTQILELGADSLDIFQMICKIEEEYDVEFQIDSAGKIKTIGDVSDHMKNALK